MRIEENKKTTFWRDLRRDLQAATMTKGQVAFEFIVLFSVAVMILCVFSKAHNKVLRNFNSEVKKPWFDLR